MHPLARRSLWTIFAVIALLFVAILLGILPFSAGFLKGPVEDAVRDATGLELSIGGPVKVRLGPAPSISGGAISLASPAAESLMEVDSFRGSISLLPLFRGQIHVRGASSTGIRVDYCAPLPNFPDEPQQDSEPPSISVDELTLADLSIRCGTATQSDPLTIHVETLTASAPLGAPMQLSAEARVSTLDLELTAAGGELDELLAEPEQFPVNARLSSPGAFLAAEGYLNVGTGSPIAEGRFEADARDLKSIAAAFDMELPELGELQARGSLRLEQTNVHLNGLRGTLGNSDFAIDAFIDVSGDRPLVSLSSNSDRLDVEPVLAGGPGALQQTSSAADSDVDFNTALEALKRLDANIDMAVGEVLGLPINLTSAELNMAVIGGNAELRSFNLEALGGQWSATGELNGLAECPELSLLANGSELDFAELNSLLALDQSLGGGIGAMSLESSSCGRSLFAHLDSLHANANIDGIEASLNDETLPLVVNQLTIATAPGERSQAALLGRLLGEGLEATLAFGSLDALLGAEPWPLDVDARGAGGRLILDGRARFVPDQLLVDTRVRLDAPDLGSLHPWVGISRDTHLPLTAMTRLRIDESEIVADKIAVSVGNTDLDGRVAWSYAKDPDLLAVTLRSQTMDLAELLTVLPPAAEDANSVVNKDDDEKPRELVLPPVDLDIEIGNIHADRLDVQDFSVAARLRKGLIDDARVSLIVEDAVKLDGKLDLVATQLPARGQLELSAENLDIGRVLRRMDVVDDLNLRAEAMDLVVSMQGTTPRQFFLSTLLDAELLGFNWQIPQSTSADGTGANDTLEVALEHVRVAAAPNQPTTWISRGQVDGVATELFMRAPHLNHLFGNLAETPITVIAAAGNDVAMIDARFDRATEDRLLVDVMISGQVIDSDGRNLSGLASPLEDYELQTNILLEGDRLQLPDIQMRLGDSHAEGQFDVDASGPRRTFNISLHAPFLQTDDLLYWSQDFRQAIGDDKETAGARVETTAETIDTSDGAAEKRGVLFLVEDLIASFRENNDLNLDITVDELRSGSATLGGGEIRLFIDEYEFRLAPLTFKLPGGGVDAEYWASTADGQLDAGLRVTADALSYGGLLRLADHESEARGLLFLNAEIAANTELGPGELPLNLLLENANGEISLAAWPENFEAGVLDLWSANVVLAILPTPDGGQPSRLNCLVTRFDVEDGLMKSRTTLLDTTDTVIRGRGTINLKDEQLDLIVWPQAKREKFFSVSTPVAVTGTFDDFQVGVAPAGFLTTLIKWYTALIYVPFKWLTGERFPPDGTSTCFDAMDWELTPELQDYFLKRDFSMPPVVE